MIRSKILLSRKILIEANDTCVKNVYYKFFKKILIGIANANEP